MKRKEKKRNWGNKCGRVSGFSFSRLSESHRHCSKIPLRSLIVVGSQRERTVDRASKPILTEKIINALWFSHSSKQNGAKGHRRMVVQVGVFVCPIDKGLSRQVKSESTARCEVANGRKDIRVFIIDRRQRAHSQSNNTSMVKKKRGL